MNVASTDREVGMLMKTEGFTWQKSQELNKYLAKQNNANLDAGLKNKT